MVDLAVRIVAYLKVIILSEASLAQIASTIQQTLAASIRTGLALQRICVETLGTIIHDTSCVHDGSDQGRMIDDVVIQTI